MLKNHKSIAVVAVFAMLAAVAPVAAAPYSDTAGLFSFSLDDSSLWGTPSVVGVDNNTLLFNGANFNVASAGTTFATSTVSIDVQSNPGYAVSVVNVSAFGRYTLNGAGSSVDFELNFDVLDMDTTQMASQGAVPTVPFPLVAGGNAPLTVNNGSFTASNSLDISSLLNFMGEHVVIDLTSITEALAPGGGASTLNVDISALQLQFNFIPEPATMSLLVMGGLALIRRRRVA